MTHPLACRHGEQELIDHVRSRIARLEAPKRVRFDELPKTGAGKVQKFVLRDALRADRA